MAKFLRRKKFTWLPHLDLTVARAFTKPSATHEPFWSSLAKPGVLKIRTQLNLWQMLRSATQPDSELDFKYPSETVTVVLKSKSPLQSQRACDEATALGENEVHLTAVPKENHWFLLEVTLQNSRGERTGARRFVVYCRGQSSCVRCRCADFSAVGESRNSNRRKELNAPFQKSPAAIG